MLMISRKELTFQVYSKTGKHCENSIGAQALKAGGEGEDKGGAQGLKLSENRRGNFPFWKQEVIQNGFEDY